MKSTNKKPAGSKSVGNSLDGNSVGQIRDILFGEQMSHYEARFAELEQSLEKRFGQLKGSLEESVAELKSLVESERNGVNTRNVSREMLAEQLSAIADAIRDGNGS